MTRYITPIGPIRLFPIERMGDIDITMVWQIAVSVILLLVVFKISQKVVSKTPGYQKDDKNIPIYYAVTCISMSSLLFFYGWSIEFVKGLIFMLTLLYASVSDIQTHSVSDFVSVLIFVTGLIGVSMTDLPLMLFSFLAVFGFLFICAMLSKNKLGGADVKLSAACAFLLGFEKGVIGLAIGLFISIITNLIIEKIKKSKDQPFPLVPYLSIGFMLMYYC